MKLLSVLIACSTLLITTACIFAQPINASDTLKVAIYDAPPFGFGTQNGNYGGLMVDIWEEIADELNWNYTYELTDMNGLLGGLQSKKYDVGLGAISITPKREKLVDFTQPINPSGTGIAIAANSQKSAFTTYWKPIIISLLQLIGSLLFVLIISGSIVWWVEKKHFARIQNQSGYENKQTDKRISGFYDALWWSAVTMTTVGYGDKVPASFIGKVLGIIWIFTSIIFLSLFTANASAIFSNNRIESPVQSNNDLRRVKVGAAAKSSGEEYLIRERIDYQPYDDIDLAIQALLSGNIDCVVSNVPFLKFYNHSQYPGQLIIVPNWLLKNNMGIAVQDESVLKEDIDRILLQKITEPKWQEAVYNYLGKD